MTSNQVGSALGGIRYSTRSLSRLATLLLAAGVLVACGGGGSDSGGGGGGNNPPPPAPPATVASVEVTPAVASVTVGQTLALTARALDANGATLVRAFTWLSSDTTKATVDANGVVSGVAAGPVSITATADAVTSAPATLTVNAVPVQSSMALIDAAVASGALDAETALTYKLFATFGDSRLPAAYQGNDADIVDTDTIDNVYATWLTLSDATKQIVAPFLLPPAYSGSWATLATAKATREARTAPSAASVTPKFQGQVRVQLNLPVCQQTIDPNWVAKPLSSTGKVKVWYDTRFTDGSRQADLVLNEMEGHIWPTLVDSVGMKAPLSDGALTGCNGGDGALDVFLVSMAVSGQTGTDLGETFPNQMATSNAPAYILLSRALRDDNLAATAAHEFMHASQWAYPLASSMSSYKWLKEATAQSAIDVVYPTVQLEQRKAPDYMQTPDKSLEDATISENRMYGSYLFFQFLNRTQGPKTLSSIWNAATSESDQVMAADTGIPGGFTQQWPLFAKALWNQDPVNTNSFEGWDALTLTPTLHEGSIFDIMLGTGAQGATRNLDPNIKHLATHYYQYRIADANVRSFSFYNHTMAFFPGVNPQVTTQVFIKKQGGIWTWEHWSDEGIDKDGIKTYCLDLIAERVTDLVIAMSNRDPKNDITNFPAGNAPRVSVSNVGCWRYKGSASVRTDGKNALWPNFTQSGDGTATLERYRTSQVPNGIPNMETFQVIQGAITGNTTATTAVGCQLTQTSNDNMTAGLATGTLNVKLGLDIGNNQHPRDVNGSGMAAGNTHTVVKCAGIPDEVSDGPNNWSWLDIPGPPEATFVVQPDGTISVTTAYTRTLTSGTTGTQTLTWNFKPLRQ
jgi:hypothetical protein